MFISRLRSTQPAATTLRNSVLCYSNQQNVPEESDNFRPLNLKNVRSQAMIRRKPRVQEVLPPRSNQMPVDQNWGNVWPGPRSFHPASVPLPVRQGYVEKGAAPGKFANAELMKIPNFLHLTPPVIKKQCEALKKFCTPWPESLKTDELCEKHFPLEVVSSDYCHSAPTIRDPLARIVTIKIKLACLQLDAHAKDKFLRLVGDRYDESTDIVTIVTDRCPTKKQNYEYAMYLLTAVYHESWRVEAWEKNKTNADMERYVWLENSSKETVESMFKCGYEEVPHVQEYVIATEQLINEGENDYTLAAYGASVRKLLNLPSLGEN